MDFTTDELACVRRHDPIGGMNFLNIARRKRKFVAFTAIVSVCGYLVYSMLICCPAISHSSGVRLRQNLHILGSEDDLRQPGGGDGGLHVYGVDGVDIHGFYGGVKPDDPVKRENIWEDEDDETDTDRDFERYDDEDTDDTNHTRLGGKSVDSIAANKTNATRKLPQAVIIGVKKCGTRALLEFIRMHPDVRAPGPEVHFFDRFYTLGEDWYRQQMPPTIEGQITMEKSPSYFVTHDVPRRMHNMSKDTKLLVVVRDPITRAISDYTQTASKRKIKSFEKLAFVNNSGVVDTSWGAIRIGVYAKHFEKWLKYFPLSSFLFVSGEELIRNPLGELTKVQQFLGLKEVIQEDHFYFNQTKGFPCLIRGVNNDNPHCLGKTKGRAHPDVDPVVVNRLREFYRPFNAKFYHMVGTNFHWDDGQYYKR